MFMAYTKWCKAKNIILKHTQKFVLNETKWKLGEEALAKLMK